MVLGAERTMGPWRWTCTNSRRSRCTEEDMASTWRCSAKSSARSNIWIRSIDCNDRNSRSAFARTKIVRRRLSGCKIAWLATTPRSSVYGSTATTSKANIMGGLGAAITRRTNTAGLWRISTMDGAARAGTTHRRIARPLSRRRMTRRVTAVRVTAVRVTVVRATASLRRYSNYGSTATINRASIMGGRAAAVTRRMKTAGQWRISTMDGAARAGTTHRRIAWPLSRRRMTRRVTAVRVTAVRVTVVRATASLRRYSNYGST